MEYPIFLILALGLILFFGQSVQAAPSQDDLAKFGEMEKAIMDLTHSILAMSEGTAGTDKL
ncbi:hypothetical protein KR018_003351 [Drosophila ironensis]|nr:hypothetical protein KR018_003351 [Drosophila ironensis]